MSEYEKEFKDIYDDIMERDSFAVLSSDEPYAPDKLTFKDFCLYPFNRENLFFTISIFGVSLFLTNIGFWFILTIFLSILYGIYLNRKILNIKDTFIADARLLIFLVYSFIINVLSWMIILIVFLEIAQHIFSSNIYSFVFDFDDGGYLFMNMFMPIISFINIVFCSGFIITYTIGETRAIYSYLRYKKELAYHNTVSFLCLLAVFVIGTNILSIDFHNNALRTFITIMIHLCSSYVILVSLLSWTSFLRKDLYPEIIKKKRKNKI